MRLNWTDFKNIVDNKGLFIQEKSTEFSYYLAAYDENITYLCRISKTDTASVTDYEAQYQPDANLKIGEQRDSDGSLMSRSKITRTGWHYHMHSLGFEVGVKDSIHDKKIDYTDYGYTTIKFYDAAMVEKTTQGTITSDAVWSIIDFEPTHDYEVAGGMVRQRAIPATSIYLWVQAVPDIPEAYGGSKVFVSNVDLSFLPANGGIDANGRTPKLMVYDVTYHTNKIRIKLRHDTGVTHKLNFLFEMFKA